MPDQPYQFQWMPKLIMSGSFDYSDDLSFKGATLVDDPDVLRKTASSPVVAEWGDIQPVKNASLIHLIAMGATEVTGPNRNADGFKGAFLESCHPTFKKHGALYRDHVNKDYSKRDGDVIKTAYNKDMGRVELLVAADHDKCADWLPDIEQGRRVDFSMGFDCKHDVCSICNHKAASRKFYCEHMKKSAGRVLPDGRKVYVDNPEGVFNDISKVGTGADQIAQHLRKVAGIDMTETLSGADLADMFGIKTAGNPTDKRAIAEKLSAMEKHVPVTSYKTEKPLRVMEKCSSVLRKAPPAQMFAELVKSGAVLGLDAFAHLVMGDMLSDIESYVKEASSHVRYMFTELIGDADRLTAVCDNDTYEPNMKSGSLLSEYDRTPLIQDFSIEPLFARERLVKQAMNGVEIGLAPKQVISNGARQLLNEYAAYKLAALSAFDISENPSHQDELILFAVMSS